MSLTESVVGHAPTIVSLTERHRQVLTEVLSHLLPVQDVAGLVTSYASLTCVFIHGHGGADIYVCNPRGRVDDVWEYAGHHGDDTNAYISASGISWLTVDGGAGRCIAICDSLYDSSVDDPSFGCWFVASEWTWDRGHLCHKSPPPAAHHVDGRSTVLGTSTCEPWMMFVTADPHVQVRQDKELNVFGIQYALQWINIDGPGTKFPECQQRNMIFWAFYSWICVDQTLYGITGGAQCVRYSVDRGGWLPLATPLGRYESDYYVRTLASDNGRKHIYIVGGLFGIGGSPTDRNGCERFNVVLDRWERMPPTVRDRRDATLLVCEDYLLAIGGRYAQRGSPSRSDVECINLTREGARWTLIHHHLVYAADQVRVAFAGRIALDL